MKTKTVDQKRYPPLQRRIFLFLVIFVLLSLLVLWLFQLFLLKPIYETVKAWEIRRASTILASAESGASLSEISNNLAKRTGICITVYEIAGRGAYVKAESHIRGSCLIHNVASDAMLNRLYSGALENGYYTETFTGNFFTGESSADDVPKSVLAARVVTGESGRDTLILLNTELEPVDTTTTALLAQLSIITVLLLIFSGVAAVLVSRAISRPITQMSAEAHKLALGTYDVHFDGGTTKETAELGEALNYAAGELSSINEMQKELLANISHDLRTPLTMISGYSQVMRDIPGENTPENMQIVIDETEHLSALVSDILDLSKLTAAAQTLNCETLSLTELVDVTLERYGKLRQKEGYRISFESDRVAFVYADKSKLLQVLYNLVNNAINHVGEDKTVIIRQICEADECRIEVTDTGGGIPAEELPKIWDRYYKGKGYHKRSMAGTGLGLSIVKNILLLHGAKFGVTSTMGQGSTFFFSLPESPAPETEEES